MDDDDDEEEEDGLCVWIWICCNHDSCNSIVSDGSINFNDDDDDDDDRLEDTEESSVVDEAAAAAARIIPSFVACGFCNINK